MYAIVNKYNEVILNGNYEPILFNKESDADEYIRNVYFDLSSHYVIVKCDVR